MTQYKRRWRLRQKLVVCRSNKTQAKQAAVKVQECCKLSSNWQFCLNFKSKYRSHYTGSTTQQHTIYVCWNLRRCLYRHFKALNANLCNFPADTQHPTSDCSRIEIRLTGYEYRPTTHSPAEAFLAVATQLGNFREDEPVKTKRRRFVKDWSSATQSQLSTTSCV